MADALTALNDFIANLQLGFGNPIGLATNIILSTIVGGIVILIVVEIFARKSSVSVNPMYAFLLALVTSIINIFGIMPFLGQFIAMIPLLGVVVLVLPVLVWIILVRLFFRELEMLHVLIIGVICYFLSIYLIPLLAGMVSGFIPV